MLNRVRIRNHKDEDLFTIDYLLSNETPIELPSDEEIETKFDTHDEKYYIFSEGAKWILEQIKQQAENGK